MKEFFSHTRLFLFFIFIAIGNNCTSQDYEDSLSDKSGIENAINLYHRFLSPEPGLYNGPEYAYNQYYPFIINEGDPFFLSKIFNDGSVYYDGVLYKNVSLNFDIIKNEILINDPAHTHIIKLNTERIEWFTILDHTFVRLSADSSNNVLNKNRFYEILYKSNTSLYKSEVKTIKENTASALGLNRYVQESDDYFIKKDNQFFKVKNKKTALLALKDRKKDILQFMHRNKLKIKKDKDNDLRKIVAYYDEIKNNSNNKSE